MAIGTPVEIGGNAQSASTAANNVAVPAGGVPQNARIVVHLSTNHTAIPAGLTVTDTRGNTYTRDAGLTDGATMMECLYSANADTALLAGDNITVTWGTQTNRTAIRAAYVTGILTIGAVDVSNVQPIQPASNAPSGAPVTTLTASTIIFGCFVLSVGNANPVGFVAGTAWMPLTEGNPGGTTNNRVGEWEYQIASATGTYTPIALQTATKAYIGLTVAYKSATPPAVPSGGSCALAESGAQNVGATLHATTSGWVSGPTSYRFQWLRDGTPIVSSDADTGFVAGTSDTYTVVAADGGHTISVRCTAHNSIGDSTAVTATNTVTVSLPPPNAPVSLFMSDITQTGATLHWTAG